MAHQKSAEEIIAESFTDPYSPPHQKGPDYIVPSESYRSWVVDGSIKIDDEGDPKPKSVVTFVTQAAEEHKKKILAEVKRNNVWVKWTGSEYLKDTRAAAKGFIKLGLSPFHGVGILGFNSPEWVMSHLGAIFAGGLAVGIYSTSSADACLHVLSDSSANVVLVENEVQLSKIIQIRGLLPHLKAIVQYTGKPAHPGVISWEELLKIGNSIPDAVLERRIKGLALNQCCTIIYTSGTVGKPKGVMLSHDNMLYLTVKQLDRIPEFEANKKGLLSYLPLSHIAALIYDVYACIYLGTKVSFASPDALKDKLVPNLLEVQPTAFFGVPRVYEKIVEKINEAESAMTGLKKNLMWFSRQQALNYNTNRTRSSSQPFLYSLTKKVVIDKIHKMIGLDKINLFISGGAPMTMDVHKSLLSLNMRVMEGYGLSESSGVHVFCCEAGWKLGSVGKVDQDSSSFQVKIDKPDEKGCGEILLRGRNIFMGYLNNEKNTLMTKTEDGWLHTDDLGKVDEDDFLFVTGRIKELIVTSAGENIPPVIIEDQIKEVLPVVSNCILIGDGRKYLTMLICLKTEMDLNTGLPIDKLTTTAINWCKAKGSQATTVSDILENNDVKVMDAIQIGIDIYNSNGAISNAQKIQKFTILPMDFCIPNEELGPTAKLKRHTILQKYNDVIDKMYA